MELLTDFERSIRQRNLRYAAKFKDMSTRYPTASKSRILRAIAKEECKSEQTIRVVLLNMGVIKKNPRYARL